jgi:hypothetical protein
VSEYTQARLDELIGMPKVITETPRRAWVEERGHFRNDMTLTSEDGSEAFTVFMRKNRDFPENFSIGLCYWPKESGRQIHLLRCNGPHGDFNRTGVPSSHFAYHIHRADAELLNAGQDPLARGHATTEYASDRDAVIHFCRTTGVKEFDKYFPVNVQLDFDASAPKEDA